METANKVKFKDLAFKELDLKDSIQIEVTFLSYYHFFINKKDFPGKIISKHEVEIDDENSFYGLINLGLDNLINKINNKPTTYIHSDSKIPLIGNIAFGIVDRNTSTLEIKPNTGCNADCIFCSVDINKRTNDIVIEKDYLVQETNKLIAYKTENAKTNTKIDLALNCHGDITIYQDLVGLVKDLRQNPNVGKIYIITNGILLNKKLIDNLIDAGLTRFHISIHSLDNEKAQKYLGVKFDNDKLIENIKYVSRKVDIYLTPVYLPGLNDEDIKEILKFANELKKETKNNIYVGIQNFLEYQYGKKPVKQISFDEFYKKMEAWEKEYNINLKLPNEEIFVTKPLPKPFDKGQKIKVTVKMLGTLPNQWIAVDGDRTITILEAQNLVLGKRYDIKILGSKHNIFTAKLC